MNLQAIVTIGLGVVLSQPVAAKAQYDAPPQPVRGSLE
jgi:hypothetical protein